MVKYDKQPINIQPSVPNALSPTINSPIIPAKCTNEPSATVELYLIKMLPSAFIKIAHFEAYRLKILERAHEIRKLIAMTLKRSQGSFGKKCMGKNYVISTTLKSNSIYGFCDAMVYHGFTAN